MLCGVTRRLSAPCSSPGPMRKFSAPLGLNIIWARLQTRAPGLVEALRTMLPYLREAHWRNFQSPTPTAGHWALLSTEPPDYTHNCAVRTHAHCTHILPFELLPDRRYLCFLTSASISTTRSCSGVECWLSFSIVDTPD